ncbi:hypothetical protein GIB67_029798 [Kingdonia uniflora]|uniref:Uncharacterized protein n=1 Tax=Kingdonia uniflora TaxID=39325 RepID=A0A7J7NJH8_9MAGN|nr:hypothetical protein GIB67_029798 [Kingdonia uniflora]
MAGNKFNSSIPRSIGRLAALESLDLSYNHLSGLIPNDLENLWVLKNFNLFVNDSEGQIPTKGSFLNIIGISVQGNDKLCGGEDEAYKMLKLPLCSSNKKSEKPIE